VLSTSKAPDVEVLEAAQTEKINAPKAVAQMTAIPVLSFEWTMLERTLKGLCKEML
jgi:hypothetical protein